MIKIKNFINSIKTIYKCFFLFLVEYLTMAHGIISEYLSEDLSLALSKHLKLPDPTKKHKATEPLKDQPNAKKARRSNVDKNDIEEPVDDYSKTEKATEKVIII